jgi:hypothetical protein
LPTALLRLGEYASRLRNGAPCAIEDPHLQGCNGAVTKVRFADGVEWAAKMTSEGNAQIGFTALSMLQEYCPELPVPRVHGAVGSLFNETVHYYRTLRVPRINRLALQIATKTPN